MWMVQGVTGIVERVWTRRRDQDILPSGVVEGRGGVPGRRGIGWRSRRVSKGSQRQLGEGKEQGIGSTRLKQEWVGPGTGSKGTPRVEVRRGTQVG